MSKEELLKYGLEVFNNEIDKFERWLIKPNLLLNCKTPLESLKSIRERKQVTDILTRIEYGIFI
jgi:uncharacterized protein (DUF2384 family)